MKRNLWKRIAATLAATVLVTGSISLGNISSVRAEESSRNLVLANGDFETGDSTNWNLNGCEVSVGINKWATANTTNTLSLPYDETAAIDVNFAYAVTLSAGTYTASVDFSGANWNSGLALVVKDAEGQQLATTDTISGAGWDVWNTVTTPEFTLTADTEVTLAVAGSQAAWYWGNIDNLALASEDGTIVTKSNITPVEAGINVGYVDLADDFITGMDISSYASVTAAGAQFYDWDGNAIDADGFFALLHEAGVNWVRIRVWNDPYDADGNGYGGGNNDLATAVVLGQYATNAGMKVLIDFHYSDFWADPSKQQVPKAWSSYSLDEKAEAIGTFTTEALTTLRQSGVDVQMVQIGNETTNAFCGESNWSNICKLFNAGSAAVRAIDEQIQIAIHFTNPERSGNCMRFAGYLDTNKVDYDVFATSYYSYWHGTLANLTSVLKSVATTYGKKVMVAETSYTYTLADGDGHGNTISKESSLIEGYAASVQGQAKMIRDVIAATAEVGEAAIGVFYWEGAWIPVEYAYDENGNENSEVIASNKLAWEKYGAGWASSYAGEYDAKDAGVWYGGSAVDNQAFFDFTGHPLESLNVFKYVRTGAIAPLEIESIDNPSVEVNLGEEISLPETVTVRYNDGSSKDVPVTWSEEDLAKVSDIGTYEIHGSIAESTEAVICTVTVSPANLLQNAGFENGATGWTITGVGASVTYDDPHSGNRSMHYYRNAAFSFTVEQTVTDLEPGIYAVYGYFQGSTKADGEETFLYVKTASGEQKADFSLSDWKNWKNPAIAEITLTEAGSITIGASMSLTAGAWGTMDDFVLYRVGDLPQEVLPFEEIGDELYYVVDGKIQRNAGLIQVNDKYYYVMWNGVVVRNNMAYKIEKTNGYDVVPGKHYIDENGVVSTTTELKEINGKTYAYVDGILQRGVGVVEIDGKLYYAMWDGQIVRNNMSYKVDKTNGYDVVAGNHYIDEDGVISTATELKDIDGKTYAYIDGVIMRGAGLIQIDGKYYYAMWNGQIVKGNNHYLVAKADHPSVADLQIEKGYYAFDENGVIVLE